MISDVEEEAAPGRGWFESGVAVGVALAFTLLLSAAAAAAAAPAPRFRFLEPAVGVLALLLLLLAEALPPRVAGGRVIECWIRMCFARASERVKDLSHSGAGLLVRYIATEGGKGRVGVKVRCGE